MQLQYLLYYVMQIVFFPAVFLAVEVLKYVFSPE